MRNLDRRLDALHAVLIALRAQQDYRRRHGNGESVAQRRDPLAVLVEAARHNQEVRRTRRREIFPLQACRRFVRVQEVGRRHGAQGFLRVLRW